MASQIATQSNHEIVSKSVATHVVTRTAIIGAGVAGAWLAHSLRQHGISAVIIEKARGSGGRLSSKRLNLASSHQGEKVEMGETELSEGHRPVAIGVDLGCSSFEISDQTLLRQLDGAVGGLAKLPYEALSADNGQVAVSYIGRQRNSSITRSLIADNEAWYASRVKAICASERIDPQDGSDCHGWLLTVDRGELGMTELWAEQVLITAPPAQASELLPDAHPLKKPLANCSMAPQWVVVIATDTVPINTGWHAELISDPSIRLCSIESDKPDRSYPSGTCVLVLQFSPQWSGDRLDYQTDSILTEALSRIESSWGCTLNVLSSHVHRWLYSLPPADSFSEDHSNFDQGIGLAGDYWGPVDRSGVERALNSAEDLMEKVLAGPCRPGAESTHD